MKKKLFIALAIILAGLTSCEDKEVLNSQANQSSEPSFIVLDESEVTEQELYEMTIGDMKKSVDADIFDGVDRVYKEASNNQVDNQGATTKALVPLLYKVVRIEYKTLDQNMVPVNASALIVYPLLRKMNKVMLINHGTQIGFAMIPTQYTSVEAIMAATGALCILPDYIGLGSTSDHPDLYLNHEVHGRTSVDALIALLDYAKAKKLSLDNSYKSYIVGYSQGGSVSLASLRRVQQLDMETQRRINLDKVYCGDGPYDLRRTFETYMEEYEQGKKMGLGSVVPLVINSMFNSYPSEVTNMRYEDFFTPWALSTGVPQAVRNNSENVIDMMLKFNGKSLGDILNIEYITEHPDHLAKLLELMDRQNLCHGWQPQYKLKLLHGNPDGVVPFSNFEEAVQGLNNNYVETKVISNNSILLTDPLLQHISGMMVMLEEILSGKF
ncbi:MAG: hypothetical protein IJ916_02500 [Paludibacteraceae bacterium]|nr:hypothetical protein [Paludibacteraceae bacterium]MBR2260557.1 hypothetical protein [Paludibacteraceae bacterium]